VNVQAGNAKLKRRAELMVAKIARCDETSAAKALEASGGSVKRAVLMCAGAKDDDAAQRMLTDAKGNLRLALSRQSAP
jgi:N-acetylmuramic acid 6-phosphate etherase